MCKVMILKGIENSALALDFMKAVAPNMSIWNTDGIGYSAINSKNELFSEKWHRNYQFMDTESVIDKDTLEALAPYKSRLPGLALNYQSYGEVTRDDLRTVTMHTRYATCGKTFENTHPFIDNGMSLIHNGVIENHVALALNKVSTCDSENALQLYNNEQLNLATSIEKFQEFTDKLKGYWAFAFLAKNAEGIYMLDIVRERAPLYWAHIPEIGEECFVFATAKDIITEGLSKLGIKLTDQIYLLTESYYHRFNAVTGAFVLDHDLEESAMNKVVYSYSYLYDKDGNYKSKYKGNNTKTEVVQPVLVKEVEEKKEESYEGYLSNKEEKLSAKRFKAAMQGMVGDEIDSFYDIDELLIDRLYAYDKFASTTYGISFEDLPSKVKLFIERKEEECYIIFDDVLEMIENFVETESVKGLFEIYREKQKA